MSRKEILYKAELAKETGRYREMVGIMKLVVKECANSSKELTEEESDLVFYAYENLIECKTRKLELFRSIEQKEESLGNEDHVSKRKDYEGKIEGELTEICNEIMNLLEGCLIPLASSTESKVFYMRKKAEFYDSLVQFKTGAEKDDAYESMMSTYRAAEKIEVADSGLRITFIRGPNISVDDLMKMFRLNSIEKEQALKEGRRHVDAFGVIYEKMLILKR